MKWATKEILRRIEVLNPDVLAIAGDIYDSPYATDAVEASAITECAKFIDNASLVGRKRSGRRKVALIPGNHDESPSGEIPIEALIANEAVVMPVRGEGCGDKVVIMDLDNGHRLVLISYIHDDEVLQNTLDEFVIEGDIVIAHATILSSKHVGHVITKGTDPLIFERCKADLCFVGDIHTSSIDQPHKWEKLVIPGTPVPWTFGCDEESHGIWTVDTSTMEVGFVPIEIPNMVTVPEMPSSPEEMTLYRITSKKTFIPSEMEGIVAFKPEVSKYVSTESIPSIVAKGGRKVIENAIEKAAEGMPEEYLGEGMDIWNHVQGRVEG